MSMTKVDEFQLSMECYKKALNNVPDGHSHRYPLYNNIGHRFKDLLLYDSAQRRWTVYLVRHITEGTIG